MSQKKINILLEAIQEDPLKPFPYFALAKEYQKLNDTYSAWKYYQHLVDHFPSYGGTYYHFALALIEENEMEKAGRIIESGLAILHKSGETNLYNELAALQDSFFG